MRSPAKDTVTAGRLTVEMETGRVIVLRNVETTGGRLKVETDPGRLIVEKDVIVFKIVEASAVATLIKVDASCVTTLIRVETTGGGVTVTAGKET